VDIRCEPHRLLLGRLGRSANPKDAGANPNNEAAPRAQFISCDTDPSLASAATYPLGILDLFGLLLAVHICQHVRRVSKIPKRLGDLISKSPIHKEGGPFRQLPRTASRR